MLLQERLIISPPHIYWLSALATSPLWKAVFLFGFLFLLGGGGIVVIVIFGPTQDW